MKWLTWLTDFKEENIDLHKHSQAFMGLLEQLFFCPSRGSDRWRSGILRPKANDMIKHKFSRLSVICKFPVEYSVKITVSSSQRFVCFVSVQLITWRLFLLFSSLKSPLLQFYCLRFLSAGFYRNFSHGYPLLQCWHNLKRRMIDSVCLDLDW